MTTGADLARMDWLVTATGNLLHYGQVDEDDNETWWEDVRFACGRLARAAMIPGPFTRMGAPRCRRCCTALGYPQGKGSPKNDPECRRLLGLDPPAHEHRWSPTAYLVMGDEGEYERRPFCTTCLCWGPGALA